MTGFARRAAAGLLAAVFGISMLAGCTPNNAAVGDTQSAGDAVAHSIKDRNSLDVAMIGSQDEQTDRLTLDAMEAGGLRPVYLPVAGTVDMQDTARQAVEDMAQRMVSIIVISGIDVSGVNHDGWYDTLTTARQAGIPVALLNPDRHADRQHAVRGDAHNQRPHDGCDAARRRGSRHSQQRPARQSNPRHHHQPRRQTVNRSTHSGEFESVRMRGAERTLRKP